MPKSVERYVLVAGNARSRVDLDTMGTAEICGRIFASCFRRSNSSMVQPTIEKLLTMRLEPMVETWRSFEQDENAAQLSFEEKLSLMVDRL